VDRRGREIGTLGEVAEYTDIAISPDGRRVAASIRDPARGQNLDVWVLETDRGVASRVSAERTDEFDPAWTPDGDALLYISDREGFYDLYRRPASGGPEEQILKTSFDKFLSGLTADGQSALFHGTDGSAGGRDDLWTAALSKGAKPEPLTRSPQFGEQIPRASLDGRWLAFVSTESGRNEVYVQPFPRGPKRRVSSNGGFSPLWRRDSRELFYQAPDGRLMSVPLRAGSGGVEFGTPEPLFDLATAHMSGPVGFAYDVDPRGERFLVIRPAPGARLDDVLAVVLDWPASLERKK
jgi:serine/threonine-protein kinase